MPKQEDRFWLISASYAKSAIRRWEEQHPDDDALSPAEQLEFAKLLLCFMIGREDFELYAMVLGGEPSRN